MSFDVLDNGGTDHRFSATKVGVQTQLCLEASASLMPLAILLHQKHQNAFSPTSVKPHGMNLVDPLVYFLDLTPHLRVRD